MRLSDLTYVFINALVYMSIVDNSDNLLLLLAILIIE